jgi:hypothetical protein
LKIGDRPTPENSWAVSSYSGFINAVSWFELGWPEGRLAYNAGKAFNPPHQSINFIIKTDVSNFSLTALLIGVE